MVLIGLKKLIKMEIPELNVKIKENEVKVERAALKVAHHELMPDLPIKRMDSNFKDMPQESDCFLTLKPLDLFDSLEKEYKKVKDFDFSKINVKDIRKHIKNI